MKKSLILAAAVLISGCGSNTGSSGGDVTSGTYALDPSHTYVTFTYLHQGLSYPLLRATRAAGELEYDADDLANSSVRVAIDTDSIRSNVDYFDDELASRKFFNADRYPHITFTSESYEATGENEGIVRGQVTIRGISQPLELKVKLNGEVVHPMTGIPVVGFSATGSLNRSDFGLTRFIPVVADQVDFRIETEFVQGSNDDSQAAVQAANQALAGS
jgi:polyisoprenoid-binding protein YceI